MDCISLSKMDYSENFNCALHRTVCKKDLFGSAIRLYKGKANSVLGLEEHCTVSSILHSILHNILHTTCMQEGPQAEANC